MHPSLPLDREDYIGLVGQPDVEQQAMSPSSVNQLEGEHHQTGRAASPHHSLVNRTRTMVGSLEPPLTSNWCIYRVPRSLRMVNEVAYTPRVISIGPLHHGINDVQIMEKHKERYLSRYIQRVSLEDLVSSIKECEESVRHCYADSIKLSSDDFVRMILLDGGFIIEYFLHDRVPEFSDENDEVLIKPWLQAKIHHDLMLLENQLPFFVLEKLYNLAFPVDKNNRPFDSFLELTIEYFSHHKKTHLLQIQKEVKHFTDLVRQFYIKSTTPPIIGKINKSSYSAIKLHAAGVKFKVRSGNFLVITFANGVIEIPYLCIDDDTESLHRNIMALEQCHYPRETYFCEFIDLMDILIDTEKDVELLVKNGIILNWLESNHALASLFNNLCQQITVDGHTSYFHTLCTDLTKYYENPWHKWKAILKRDYFRTPWRVASTFAAFTLLALTFIQTINSFK